MQFCISFIAELSHLGSFKHKKAVSFQIGLWHMFITFFMTETMQFQAHAPKVRYLWRPHSMKLRDKLCSCGIGRIPHVEALLWIQTSQLLWLCTMTGISQESVIRQVCAHSKEAQKSIKGQVEWPHMRSLLVPSWCGASRTVRDCGNS